VEAVARLGPAGEEALSIALADEACAVRSASARAVVRLGFPSADADLEALAQDRHPRVRSAAMSALAERAVVPGARARVLGLLAAGVSSGGIVALAALEALRRIGGQDAAAIAASGLRSPEPEIAEAAAACIGEHGGEALSGELIALIAHPAWSVRARAARGLAAQRAVAAVPHLYARLGEERDEFARDALLAALAALES
jgi:HEAT repeat protein